MKMWEIRTTNNLCGSCCPNVESYAFIKHFVQTMKIKLSLLPSIILSYHRTSEVTVTVVVEFRLFHLLPELHVYFTGNYSKDEIRPFCVYCVRYTYAVVFGVHRH